MLLRVIPLRSDGHRSGALILLRDVTELRLRERELVSKEATIREIHHRVKNNLQTVAALLRLQGRRMELPEARAALDDAVRRVGSIALVHETLSQSFDDDVDFDEIADRLLRTVLDVARGDRRRRPGERRPGRLVRAAARRRRDAAGDGADRADPERRRRMRSARRAARSRWRSTASVTAYACGSATTAWGCRRTSTRPGASDCRS